MLAMFLFMRFMMQLDNILGLEIANLVMTTLTVS